MNQGPDKRHRSIRLKDYDYAQAGAYFVTICTHDRALLFDDVTVREIAEQCWLEVPEHFPAVELDEWVVMSNHLHGIIVIADDDGPRRGVQLPAPGPQAQVNAPTSLRNPANPFSMMAPRRETLAVIIRTYKAAVTTLCRRAGRVDFAWQRNYYEHIIRNEDDLARVRKYIADNPLQWKIDNNNPNHILTEVLRD